MNIIEKKGSLKEQFQPEIYIKEIIISKDNSFPESEHYFRARTDFKTLPGSR